MTSNTSSTAIRIAYAVPLPPPGKANENVRFINNLVLPQTFVLYDLHGYTPMLVQTLHRFFIKKDALFRERQYADKPHAKAQGLSNCTKIKSLVKGVARSADRFLDE